MWKLPKPAVTGALEELLRALTYVNGELVYAPTPGQIAALLQLYFQYDAAEGRPSPDLVGEHLGAEFLAALHSAYDEVHEGRRLAELRDRLKASVQLCPYCGFGEIRDLDHHLPRSLYRALAIYARNLVPCCSPCNGKKRAVAGEGAADQFAHVYFDEMPEERFLVAHIEVSPAGGLQTEFSIVRCTGMTNDLYNRLLHQFSRLGLDARYRAQVNTFISSQRPAIEGFAKLGGNSLRAWLKDAHDTYEVDFGLNDWRTALTHSLENSDEFCDGGFAYCFGKRLSGA